MAEFTPWLVWLQMQCDVGRVEGASISQHHWLIALMQPLPSPMLVRAGL